MSVHVNVGNVQLFLLKHGYLSYTQVNKRPGYFGDDTQKALRTFLRDHPQPGLTDAERKGAEIGAGALQAMLDYEEASHVSITPGKTHLFNPETMEIRSTSFENGAWKRTLGSTAFNDFDARRPTVVIDAGHGAQNPRTLLEDPGAMATLNGKPVLEESVTREMAMRTARALNRHGYDVIVTRDQPTQLGKPNAHGLMIDMPKPAIGGDSFRFRHLAALEGTTSLISLHFDIAGNKAAQGTRIFADRRAGPGSTSTALRNQIIGENRETAGADIINDAVARNKGLYVLHPRFVGPVMPALLIEMGFASNSRDLQRLAGNRDEDIHWRNGFADELADEITSFHDMRPTLTKMLNGSAAAHTGRARSAAEKPATATISAPPAMTAPSPELRAQQAAILKPYLHAVDEKEHLKQIADLYGASWKEVARVNAITDPNHLTPGQDLTIPNVFSYEVQQGDTLHSLAKRFATSVDRLKHVNAMRDNHLGLGDILIIPDVVMGHVAKGQGLLQTARGGAGVPEASLGCVVDTKELAEIVGRMNGLQSETLSPGQVLFTPKNLPCKPGTQTPVR